MAIWKLAKLIIVVMYTSLYDMARGDDMDIEIAILVAGVLVMVGGIVGGGAVYAGLEKLAEALKQKLPFSIFSSFLFAVFLFMRKHKQESVIQTN